MKLIYTITCCTDDFKNRRCFGWFSSAMEAIEELAKSFHITECLYDIAILEESQCGIHGRSKILRVYNADYKNRKWIEATTKNEKDRPEIFQSCNYNGIG